MNSPLPVSTPIGNKRPLPDSPIGPSPSNPPPLAQRIRKDIQVGESEVESPEKEVLRSFSYIENSPSPLSPCAKGIPSPAPLVFTPVLLKKSECLNCEAEMTPDHQCEAKNSDALPLCHYCCHKGSGENPVHYFEQCLCADKVCSCQCYCTDEQLKHKLQFYPRGSCTLVCVDIKDRSRAKEVAEKRIGQWPIFPCTSENCVYPVIR